MAHDMQSGISEDQLGSSKGLYDALKGSDTFFKVDYSALNSSGVSGGAFLALDSDTNELTVVTTGKGVEAGVPHPQHIHGFDADDNGDIVNSQSPTLAQDGDGDGIVELGEGAGVYGAIQLALTDPAGGDVPNFPTTDGDSFVQTTTYDLDALDAGANNKDGEGATLSDVLTADNLTQREVVLHGMTLDGSQGVGTEGQANGESGYSAVLPIASGEIERVDTDQVMADLEDGRISVSNDVVAFDTGGNAGEAYSLYDAILGRSPDQSGLSYFTNQLDAGASLSDVANTMLGSSEFTDNFGAVGDLSDAGYVDFLYENVLGRDAEDAGQSFYTDQLNQGVDRGQLMADFSESQEHQDMLVGQIQGGIMLDDSVMA